MQTLKNRRIITEWYESIEKHCNEVGKQKCKVTVSRNLTNA
jgi:hypothetical protein